MEPCPFCNTNVNEDLLRFGGTCPSCFGEIPGEEAATDPGEAANAALVQADEERVRRRMLIPAIVALIVLLSLSTTVCFVGYKTMYTPTGVVVAAELTEVTEVTVDPDAPKHGEGRLVVDPVIVDEATGRMGYIDSTGAEIPTDPETNTVTIVNEAAGIKRVINATTGDTRVYDLETGEEALVDETKGVAVIRDEESGTVRLVDPRTGITTVVDEETGLPTAVINPVTGETQNVDGGTGFLVVEDPVTGVQSVVNTATGIVADVDERTGVAELVDPEDGSAILFDPETSETATVDPRTGTAAFVDEETGTTTVVDPRTGATAETDEGTGAATLVNPRTGTTTIVNPEDGTLAKIDPLTGTAIAITPEVEASDEDLEGIAALPHGLPSDDELAALDEDLEEMSGTRIRTRSELTENFQVGEMGATEEGQGTTAGTRIGQQTASVGAGLSSGPREATVKVDASTDVTTTKASQYTVLGLTPDVSISRREQLGIRLEDDRAIIEMIKRVMDTEIPRLRVCYERRLKQDPDLEGRWALNFTVLADGYTEATTAAGLDRKDAQLEACVVEKLKSWQFQKIREDQPIKKTVTFRPS